MLEILGTTGSKDIFYSSFFVVTALVLLVIPWIWFFPRILWSPENHWNLFYNLKLVYEYFLHSSIRSFHVDLPKIPLAENGAYYGATKNSESTDVRVTKRQQALNDPNRKGYIQCFDPSTGQWLGEVKAMNASDVHEILSKAAIAQKQWQLTTYEQRRRVLRTIQKFITEHVQEICWISSIDSGKPMVDAALGEVITTCEKIRTICSYGELWLQPQFRPVSPMLSHKIATVEYIPMGIIATIAPWNYPYVYKITLSFCGYIGYRCFVNALFSFVHDAIFRYFFLSWDKNSFHNLMNHIISGIFAGNAVVGKVSEYTSWSAVNYYDHIVKQALISNGHNPDLVATITGFADAGSALCSDPLVDKIIFTGSPAIGKRVMETASKYLKPVVLELGGKDAMVLMDDITSLKDVVPWVLRGCYQNCGQNCVGVERVFVYEKIYDEFLGLVLPKVENMRQGIPTTCDSGISSTDVDCGSMVTSAQITLIQELIDDAVTQGAKVLCGGSPVSFDKSKGGQFYPPTIVVNVTPAMRIFQEEVFGPVMTVIKVPNNDDMIALRMINNSNFGLSSSVFCRSQNRGLALGRQIRSGMCCINDFGSNYLIQSLPFGGVKESGFGRFAGIEGLRALCLERSILIDRFPSLIRTSIPPPIDYPIDKNKGLPFVTSLVQLFYSESLIEKVKGILGLIKYGS